MWSSKVAEPKRPCQRRWYDLSITHPRARVATPMGRESIFLAAAFVLRAANEVGGVTTHLLAVKHMHHAQLL